jgi:hypothetical protein
MRTAALLVAGAFAVVACGAADKPGGPSPGPSGVVCGPLEYISGDACVPLRIGSDGGVPRADAAAGEEAGVDAGAEAGGDAGIDVTTACLVNDDIFVIAGSDWVHSGPPLVIEGGTGWSVDVTDDATGRPDRVAVGIGANWGAVFSTIALGTPLAVGTYTGAERESFEDPNHPGLSVSGDGAGCNTLTGQFEVLSITVAPDDAGTSSDAGASTDASISLDAGVSTDAGAPTDGAVPHFSFTATFEQHCEGGSAFNVGCVHVVQ